VALLLLTNQPDMRSAYGATRLFWKRCRDRWGDLTYAWWIELTAAGLPHVHAMLVNPPRGFWSQETKEWLEAAWGNRFVKRKWKDASWFNDRGTGYVLGYAKKFGEKAYQQQYEELPREIRAFGTSLLEHTLEELAQHESAPIIAYVPPGYDRFSKEYVDEHLLYIADQVHTGDWCSLVHVTKVESVRRRSERARQRQENRRHSRVAPCRVPGIRTTRQAYSHVSSSQVTPPGYEMVLAPSGETQAFTEPGQPTTLSTSDQTRRRNTPDHNGYQATGLGCSQEDALCAPTSETS
jgi:hypothetical protein